jgi:hypothetical protein
VSLALVRRRPLAVVVGLLLIVLVVGSVIAGLALTGGDGGSDPGHELDGLRLQNPLPEPHDVEIRVRRGPPGDRTTVASTRVRVPAADVPTPTDDSGVASGVSAAGTVRPERTWSGPGTYVVDARQVGREAWATLDLGAVERADEAARDGTRVECYVAVVTVGTSSAPDEPGVSVVDRPCRG